MEVEAAAERHQWAEEAANLPPPVAAEEASRKAVAAEAIPQPAVVVEEGSSPHQDSQ